MTIREQDEFYTRKLEKFMDSQYAKLGLLNFMERIEEKDMQMKGIDIILDNKDGIKYIDEKFAIDYRNKDLLTYSFELSSNNNCNSVGWFLNNDSLTTHYLLLWFKSDKDIDCITSFDACLVEKKAICNMLLKDGIVLSEVLDLFNRYSKDNVPISNDNINFYIKEFENGTKKCIMKVGKYTISQSDKKEEAPINLIIPKGKLMKLAELTFHSSTPIDVDKEIENSFCNKRINDFAKLEISDKALRLLTERGIISGNLWFVDKDGCFRQKQVKVPTDRTKIVYRRQNAKKINEDITVAIYDKYFCEWVAVHDCFKNIKKIGPYKVVSYTEHITKTLKEGLLPIGFVYTDKFHNRIKKEIITVPDNGDKIFSVENYLNNKRIDITYDKQINAYVMKDANTTVSKLITKIAGLLVLSEEDALIKKLNNHFNSI